MAPALGDAQLLHGPVAILDLHRGAVLEGVFLRDGFPPPFSILPHAVFDPLGFLHCPFL